MEFCPICLRVFTANDDKVEFQDFPGITYHAACVNRVGVSTVRQVLRDQAAAAMQEEAERATSEAAKEPTEEIEPATSDKTE